MSNIGKPYSFHTLFNEKFKVPRRDLGRKPDQSLTLDAQDAFLSGEVEVAVNEIVIPKMQRDYAQGRTNESEVRKNFLKSLYEAIVDETGRKRCSLNFIYGHFLESHEHADAVSFVPYDGQQRLTTLYLLHWYASRRENTSEDYIRAFHYDTRFSSTVFTTMFLPGIKTLTLSEAEAKWLAKSKVGGAVAGEMVPVGEIDGQGVFSRWLMNKNGFAKSWRDDPTVRGMLEMLDAIHDKFHAVPNLWLRLRETDPARMPIYFFFQRVSRNSEAGSIFIKMNSRGKLLTEFECFKADFLRLLRQGNYSEDERKQLAARIDKTWEKSFWNLALRQNLKETDTDVLLMRYVNFTIDLIGFERNLFKSRNGALHLYNSERLNKVLMTSEGTLVESAIEDLTFAVDTWCGPESENRVDEYFQGIFRKEEKEKEEKKGAHSRIRLFFNPDPKEIFQTIVLGNELSLNAVAVFHAVLVARRKGLSPDLLDLRLRSIRNLVYFMDKSTNELPYILQKVRLVMENGLSVDFGNDNSTRKFTESQIREEQFKEWLATNDSHWYWKIREFEESDWFKGHVGALLYEVLNTTEAEGRLSLLNKVLAKRLDLFEKLFSSGNIPDSIIRKALFATSEKGFDYWVISGDWLWMGASIDDFAWKAARPFFTREGKPQDALRALLAHPFFDTAHGSGKDLMEAFANRPRACRDRGGDQFDVVYYLNRYYDDFFERWSKGETDGRNKCVGRIFSGNGGLTMQMLDGKTRSSLYWDPYLFVALKHVDEESVKIENINGKFKGLLKQYDVWTKYSITHRETNAEIWNGSCGVHVKASLECLNLIKEALAPSIEMEEVKDENTEESMDAERLLRTRAPDDQKCRDRLDRIEVCEKLLMALTDTFPV